MSQVGKDFIFIHIFKCGGNSMKHAVRQLDPKSTQPIGAHTDICDIYNHFENRGQLTAFNNKFKFVVVRNPYDWLGSTYHYIRRAKGHPFNKKMNSININKFIDWFIDSEEAMKRPLIPGSNKYLTQKQFITKDRTTDGEVVIDYFTKLEEIGTGWKFICDKVGWKHSPLPVKNKNGNKKSTYKTEFDSRAISRIQETFSEDFEYFGYKK